MHPWWQQKGMKPTLWEQRLKLPGGQLGQQFSLPISDVAGLFLNMRGGFVGRSLAESESIEDYPLRDVQCAPCSKF